MAFSSLIAGSSFLTSAILVSSRRIRGAWLFARASASRVFELFERDPSRPAVRLARVRLPMFAPPPAGLPTEGVALVFSTSQPSARSMAVKTSASF